MNTSVFQLVGNLSYVLISAFSDYQETKLSEVFSLLGLTCSSDHIFLRAGALLDFE